MNGLNSLYDIQTRLFVEKISVKTESVGMKNLLYYASRAAGYN